MYSLSFDKISRRILVAALEAERRKLATMILDGEVEEHVYLVHEQTLQLMRSVLYAKEKGVERTTPHPDQTD